jgi:uncharacterized protein
MQKIIGREKELQILADLKTNSEPEFVAVYGRRRIGKTFLIRKAFENQFDFYLTGIANASTEQQLMNFRSAFIQQSDIELESLPKDWFEAFQNLRILILKKNNHPVIIFLDELPWLDTSNSDFVMALEHFWNSFGSAQENLKLIVCGSAASWIINKLINNHGGLHNRITKRIPLAPFTLKETEQFLLSKDIVLDRYQIIQLYIVMGGIPFYLNAIKKGFSAFQNIDNLCFNESGLLRNEYKNLYHSLFQNAEKHETVIEILSKKSMGLSRDEIIKLGGLSNGGNTTKILEDLETSGFIKKYLPFNRKSRNSLYQLIDNYSLFYHKFIKDSKALGENTWHNMINSATWRAWSGYAFEIVCLSHISSIKKALSINGIYSEIAAWRSLENAAQIDLLIDRKDNVITVCEIKFSTDEFIIDKAYAQNLKNKLQVLKSESKTKKTLFLAMITTFGIKNNDHSTSLVQNSITMDSLFE